MWTVEKHLREYVLVKKGSFAGWWYSGLLVALGIVAMFFSPVVTIVCFIGGSIVWNLTAAKKRRTIRAVVRVEPVVGGTLLSVMDAKNQRHEIVTTAEIAADVSAALTRPA